MSKREFMKSPPREVAGTPPVLPSLALTVLLACAGCTRTVNTVSVDNAPSPPTVTGGRCDYDTTPGLARVTEIKPRAGEDRGSAYELEVSFDFAPEGRGFEHNDQFKVVLPKSQIDAKGIKPGAEYRGTMSRRTTGTCVPYSFNIEW